jgi:hypothetical protein
MTVTMERQSYTAAEVGTVDLLNVPPRLTVAIDGFGDRSQRAFRDAFDTLRPIAWALHLQLRSDQAHPRHVLAPMEALWWTEHGLQCWRLFISERADVPADLVCAVVRDVPATKNLPDVGMLDVCVLKEGLCAQTLHLGSIDDVAAAVAEIDRFVADYDLVTAGSRHEIYLSHMRRCLPEHMRTIVRVPVRPV